MWCPNCRSDVEPEGERCPACGAELEAPQTMRPGPAAMEPEFLMLFQDRGELEQAVEILERAGVPHLCREPESGAYLRLVSGSSFFGTELYVDRRFTHRALRLLRQFDHAAEEPFEEEALEAAMDEYAAEYGDPLQEEVPDSPASPEGYRMLWVFLAIFGVLALIPLLRSLLL